MTARTFPKQDRHRMLHFQDQILFIALDSNAFLCFIDFAWCNLENQEHQKAEFSLFESSQLLRSAKEPDADQGGCRICCVYSSRGSKARLSEIHSTGKQDSSESANDNQNQESEFWNYRQGLGRIRIDKQRGVVYNITINWLTLNRHRIKINIPMG